MLVDCISDLHGYFPKLKGGDLLIIGGDWTARDSSEEVSAFLIWAVTRAQKQYKKVIYIAGNHDNFIYEIYKKGNRSFQDPSLTYLCDSGTEFDGLKIWGSPWTKTFPGMNPLCKAFTCDTEEELAVKWALIPDDIDILITHSPPYNIFDETSDGRVVGSTSLLIRTVKIEPQLHVFGHIHENGGRKFTRKKGTTTFINASRVNEHYRPVNKVMRIEI